MFLHKSKVMVQLRWGEWDQGVQTCVRVVLCTSASWLHRRLCKPCCQPPSQAYSSLQNLLPLSPEMYSPWPDWQPFNVDSHLTSHLSHPPLPNVLDPGDFWDPHFLCPPTLCTFSFPTASPKLDLHLQQLQLPPGFLPPVKYIYELLSSSQLPHARHLTALWVLAGFYKLCCYHLLVPWSAVCNAPPLLPQWLSPALCLAFCSGADSMIWPLMRLKTTWTQAAPAKNLPTHNLEGRGEEYIQTKIKRKHKNVIVPSFLLIDSIQI